MAYLIAISLAFIGLLHTVTCQDQPQITQIILPEIKRAGETGRLECTITRQGSNTVFWIQRKSNMVISSNDNIDVEDAFNPMIDGYRKYDVIKIIKGDLNTYQLILRFLQPTDSGIYTCQVKQRGTDLVSSKEGEMIVLLPPAISLRETTQTVSVQEGENVRLYCVAEGYPEPIIKWVRPNGMALPFNNNTFSYVGKELILKNVKREDRGIYRCIADNTVRPAGSFDATLYIQFKPTAYAVQDTYGQAQNRLFDVVLECRISGNPQPNLQWYKKVGPTGRVPIGNDDKHVIHTLISYGQELSISESWFQLTIINVQGNDYGYYYCEGSNTLGRSDATVQLYETSECQGPNCPAQNQVGGTASAVVPSLLLLFSSILFMFKA